MKQARKDILEAERNALRVLCQGAAGRPLGAEGARLLAKYHFADPQHQIVFDALREIPAETPQRIREQLPVWLNNRGFPDFDLEPYFEPHGLTAEQGLDLLRGLGAEAAGDSRADERGTESQ